MNELRYPVGMQSFSKIIEQGYVYVDKTRYIKALLKQGQFIFRALEQIRERDYAGRYSMDSRQVYLIGANFIENKDTRGLEYEISSI